MQEKYFTYVLYAEAYDKIYIGFTTDPTKRLDSHNSAINKGWTRSFQPWKMIYHEEYSTKKEALVREKQLKTYQGREFIRNELILNKKK